MDLIGNKWNDPVTMLVNFLVLIVGAVFIVTAVRTLLIPGIDAICVRLKLSTKSQGQIIGFATSVPELTIVLISAFNGVFDAGIWNIISSNIINWILFLSAIVAFRQQMELINLRFVDEILFGVFSVIVPLTIHQFTARPSLGICVFLIVVFVLYKVLDAYFNKSEKGPEQQQTENRFGAATGAMMIIIGLGIILVATRYIGSNAKILIVSLGTPSWLVGWILGLITSIPELASFLEIYRIEKKGQREHLLADTQQALDALVSSNMANLCIILPAGVLVAYFLQ